MWLLFARAPVPDARHWPGRRRLASLDAVAWPVGWIVASGYVPFDTGPAGKVLVSLAVLAAVRRLHRAIWRNHRYQFTTGRWGAVVGALSLLGWVLKLTVGAS